MPPEAGDRKLGLRSSFAVSEREDGVASLLQCREGLLLVRDVESLCMAIEELLPCLVLVRPERERLDVVPRGGRVRVHGERSVARRAERQARRRLELGGVLPRGA